MGTTISGDTGITFPDATTQSKAVSQTTPFAVTASATTGAQLNLPEGANNGAHFVSLKAPDALAADTTFTLPTSDGTNGQFLQTNGAGALAFASVAPGGTTGQVQVNNAGVFGAVAEGTAGQVLTSGGAGVAPSFATPSPVPGAFGQFSVVSLNGANTQYVAAQASDMLSAGGFASSVVSNWTANSFNYLNPKSFFYSSYYGCWFCAALDQQGGTSIGVYSSKNGLNWTLVLNGFRAKSGAGSTAQIDKIAIDDSNGALFVTTIDNTNLQYLVFISSGLNWNSFSSATIGNYGSLAFAYDLLYIDTGSTSTSAMVLIAYIDGVSSLRTCNAGATSFTTRLASGVAGSLIQYNRASGFAFSSSGTIATYFTNNNAQTGWANNASPGVSFSGGNNAISNGVMVGSLSGNTVAYSTTGSGSWTSIASFTGGYTLQAVTHNGSAWIGVTDGGLYYNTNALPTGAWTRNSAAGATTIQGSSMRQRYI